MKNFCILWSNFEMNVCFDQLGGMCALFYENQLGIKKSDKFCLLVLSENRYEIPWTLSFKSPDSPPCICFMQNINLIGTVVLEKKSFERFLPYMGMTAILNFES